VVLLLRPQGGWRLRPPDLPFTAGHLRRVIYGGSVMAGLQGSACVTSVLNLQRQVSCLCCCGFNRRFAVLYILFNRSLQLFRTL